MTRGNSRWEPAEMANPASMKGEAKAVIIAKFISSFFAVVWTSYGSLHRASLKSIG